MKRSIDAVVTGFVKSPVLLEKSLAPLRRLHQEGIVRSINYVTWASPEIDAYVAPVCDMPEITLIRFPQPDVQGSANQRGVIYQVRNLEAALGLLPHDDGLVLKWRPDFVAKYGFLRNKLLGFDKYSSLPENRPFGISMPSPVFRNKLWIPWADSNQPFFYEDAAFLGHRDDVKKLITSLTPTDKEILGDPLSGSYAHVVRYGKVFADAYPLFKNYLRFYRSFVHELAYRQHLVPYLLADGFFWHVIVAHAWILYSQFHVDIGDQGDLTFYANAVNRDADWSRFDSLQVAHPYTDVGIWQNGTKAGEAFPSLQRAFARLMDDSWQAALFTQPLPDLPRPTIAKLLEHISHCRDGRLKEIEAEFYRGIDRIYRDHRPRLAS